MRNNKGVTLVDIVIAIMILCLFVGLIGSFYYQIAFDNALIKLNGYATYYALKAAEDIDKLTYSEIDNMESIIEGYNMPETFDLNITVEKYNEIQGNEGKEDILKIATIEVKYKCFNEDKTYKLQKLKVKEK